MGRKNMKCSKQNNTIDKREEKKKKRENKGFLKFDFKNWKRQQIKSKT
jgi:hypothetical protein